MEIVVRRQREGRDKSLERERFSFRSKIVSRYVL